ncbi:hypothetical protein GOP47_0025044 [Adiantum capillus-veneris]|uniref:Uncharacterized protein n=1 Tax=Adiantum capillus-veneris TaxID=13818 RepID=A0A9D4Z470_ADICA|nr:hypothetical protein GOP47_0025044 [Adiantum capillus-veneris]
MPSRDSELRSRRSRDMHPHERQRACITTQTYSTSQTFDPVVQNDAKRMFAPAPQQDALSHMPAWLIRVSPTHRKKISSSRFTHPYMASLFSLLHVTAPRFFTSEGSPKILLNSPA